MRGRLLRWGTGLAGWALLGVFFATQNQVTYAQYDRPPPFATTLSYTLCSWLTWAPFAPLAIALARRFPLSPPGLWRSAGVHLAAAAAVIPAKLWTDAAARALLEHLYGPGERLTLSSAPSGGVRVTLRVPFSEAA